MRFSDVIGQQEIKNHLVKMVQGNRLSHALMLHGLEGFGKKALALAFAQYIVCQNRSESDSCGECPACRKAEKMVHPDIHYSFPIIRQPAPKKSYSDLYIDEWREMMLDSPYFTCQDWDFRIGDGNKRSLIPVDESREIIKKLNFKPFESEYKVMLIWLPERMNNQASNALLKTLEEPYPKTLILMISEKPNELLTTILSRVQQIKVPPIKSEFIKSYIQEKFSVDEEWGSFAAKYSVGSIPKAIQAVQQSEKNQQYHQWFVNYMRLSYSNKMLELIDLNNEIIANNKQDIQGFLSYSMRYLRDNYLMNRNQMDLVALIGEEKAFSDKFSAFISDVNIDRMYQFINNCINELNRNANAKIQLQVLAIEMVRAFSLV